MRIGLVSIQRDRKPYILEWIAFHLAIGFNEIIIYSHKNQDGMNEIIRRISEHYPVILHELDDVVSPQIVAYNHAVETHVKNLDWIAFIDGDEFLFPTQHKTMAEALSHFADKTISGIGVYWKCYGSSGHVKDPEGLVFESYTRHSGDDYYPNTFVKSILRGRDPSKIHGVSAHFFVTTDGIVDEQMLPIGSHIGHKPSYQYFRINHYITQSYDFYRYVKIHFIPPDGNSNSIRTLEVFDSLDVNDHDDGIRYKFLIRLKLKIEEILLRITENDSMVRE